MNLSRPFFSRKALAAALARSLASESLTDLSKGIFLAAPHRTGKSSFLKYDFIPECVERGWLPIYVNLGEQTNHSAQLISSSIAHALHSCSARVTVNKVGNDRCNLLNRDSTQPQLLPEALEALHQISEQMVVLIVDDAQCMLDSPSAINAMFALKTARDRLNCSHGQDGLRLIFAGSSRDKLLNLVHTIRQPFYGAHLAPFPLLDNDFVEFFTTASNQRLAIGNQFSVEDMENAFELVGRRPELLFELVAEVGGGLGQASSLGELLRTGVLRRQSGVWRSYENCYHGLPPLQKAVLEVLAERTTSQQAFAPFSKHTLQDVACKLKLAGSDSTALTQNIQKALDALRKKELVWRSSHGNYALEDPSMALWLSGSHAHEDGTASSRPKLIR
jgi:hypothetical protein